MKNIKELILQAVSDAVIEEKQKHHRHQIHHRLHPRHCLTRLRHLLVHVCIYQVGCCHQQTEQTNVTAIERNIKWQLKYRIVG